LAVDAHIAARAHNLRPVVVRLVREHTPNWRPSDGLCPACALAAMQQHAGRRSSESLHHETTPPTTLPYYHPDEETALSQVERLADYFTFPGRNVTVAFLDSGYFPHPDLSTHAPPADLPPWERLSAPQLRATLQRMQPRLVDYVDLTEGADGGGLDALSLWDGAGDSWHGQMTTVLALGNGLLSNGRYRGFAPQANALPIKVGRGDGRIPEEDILCGLEWLLEDRRWERYQVRVLNISIGGDFPQHWRINPVCLAADKLTQRGVFVVAAAANSGRDQLLAPAQTPSVLTVGGIDDHNRLWDPLLVDGMGRLELYRHNYGLVVGAHGPQRKPELLAPATFIPGPILPVSPIFREMHAIGRLRRTLRGSDAAHVDDLLAHWQRTLHGDELPAEPASLDESMSEVWQAVRKRMNAHKWIHPAYQHVEGTSVSAAQVSAVAAQMVQANANLTPEELHTLLRENARPLFHLDDTRSGAGLLQPAHSVAAALRTSGGALTGLPRSATVMRNHELQKWTGRIKVSLARQPNDVHGSATHVAYFGFYAPQARRVQLIGSFNHWKVSDCPLQRTEAGWWHTALPLPDGDYVYRFWMEDDAHPHGEWLPDPENQMRAESGYLDYHSRIVVD
jgi:serine protease AprX